ncbi:MAG: ferrous iron transport protein B [Planctomycetaceae bacterium]
MSTSLPPSARPACAASAADKQARPLRVALIGNPNTGKSTLFNALAGLRVRTGNYPGVTVEERVGQVKWEGHSIELIDLPGTYSLSARSPDEMVAVDVLTGHGGQPEPDVIVCICNAGALERHLFLVSQVLEIGRPVVLCLNMWDAVRKGRLTIDCGLLSQRLGVPVVSTEAHRRAGLEELRAAIVTAAMHGQPPKAPAAMPDVFEAEVRQLREWLLKNGCPKDLAGDFLMRRALLDEGGSVVARLRMLTSPELKTVITEARARLREQGCVIPGVEAAERYKAISELTAEVVRVPENPTRTPSERLDMLLTHRVLGLLICAAVMLAVFASIYWISAPLSDGVEAVLASVSDVVTSWMSPGPFRSLMVDGVIAGVGSVLVFLPQIAILFLFIAILEDCGYMARAAFLMDRVMALIGLSGRSFLPLMSSFACAVPGIMATRSIENRRDRFVTILVAPLMSCSARLPVYVLLTYAFVPDQTLAGWLPLRGLVLLAISSLGLIVAIPVACILRNTAFRGDPSPFLLELPDYRMPSLQVVVHRVFDSSKAFVLRAGTLIFATTVVIWAAGSFPGAQDERYELMSQIEQLDPADPESELRAAELGDRLNAANARLLEQSLLGRVGHAIEPVVKPLGWDWKIGMGVVASFPAREVIIATLGTIYSLGGEVDETSSGLRGAMKSARWPDGKRVYTIPVAVSIMVFFALCAQCVSTLVVMRRETNSWRWPAFSFVYMTLLAWIGAFVTYQIGSRLG